MFKFTHKDHGRVISVTYMRRARDGVEKHHADLPAYQEWDAQGNLTAEEWFQCGVLHRGRYLPARVHFRGDKKYAYWYRRGVLHRDGGPTFVCWRGDKITNEEWFNDGVKINARYSYDTVTRPNGAYVPPMMRK